MAYSSRVEWKSEERGRRAIGRAVALTSAMVVAASLSFGATGCGPQEPQRRHPGSPFAPSSDRGESPDAGARANGVGNGSGAGLTEEAGVAEASPPGLPGLPGLGWLPAVEWPGEDEPSGEAEGDALGMTDGDAAEGDEPAGEDDPPSEDPTGEPDEPPADDPADEPDEPAEPPAIIVGPGPAGVPVPFPGIFPDDPDRVAHDPQQPEEPARPGDLLLVEAPTDAQRALADILARHAENLTTQQEVPHSQLAVAEALSTLAVRLAPGDRRLAWQLVAARMAQGDVPATLEALEHYRRLAPDDRLAQIRFIDLAADQMESADERAEYLLRVGDTSRVPAEVRSHALAMASLLLREQLRFEESEQAVERAIDLDGYNPVALQLRYERLAETGAPRAERVRALAVLLRSNILQPATTARLAEELVAAGLEERAIDFYRRSRQTYAAMGQMPAADELLDYASLLIATRRPQQVPAALQPLRGQDDQPSQHPDAERASVRADVAMLSLLAERMALGPEGSAEAVRRELNRRHLRLRQLVDESRGEAPGVPPRLGAQVPQTPLPDVAAASVQLRDRLRDGEMDEAEQRRLAAIAGEIAMHLADVAWLHVYFRAEPAPDGVMSALDVLVPRPSGTLSRLQGWQLWRQGQPDAARQRLEPVAPQEPLAGLALVLMDREQGRQVRGEAQRLLDGHRGGLFGAFLVDGLMPLGAELTAAEEASDVREALGVLDMRLFDLLEADRVRHFYSVSVDALKVRHEFGEPILVRVVIRNSGRDVLTIGPEGVIKPGLRLDATVRGVQEQQIPGAAWAELGGRTRLNPGERLEQVVRLDGPQMAALLSSVPQLSLTINGEATTNPTWVQTPDGVAFMTAAGGQTQRLRGMIDRRGLPLDLTDQRIVEQITERLEELRTGEGVRRLRSAQLVRAQLEFLGNYLQQVQEQGGVANEEIQQWQGFAAQLGDALRRASQASVGPRMRADDAWVYYCYISVLPLEDRSERIARLLEAQSLEARAVGLLAVVNLIRDEEAAIEMVEPLVEREEDPTLLRLAETLLDWARVRVASRPQE